MKIIEYQHSSGKHDMHIDLEKLDWFKHCPAMGLRLLEFRLPFTVTFDHVLRVEGSKAGFKIQL